MGAAPVAMGRVRSTLPSMKANEKAALTSSTALQSLSPLFRELSSQQRKVCMSARYC